MLNALTCIRTNLSNFNWFNTLETFFYLYISNSYNYHTTFRVRWLQVHISVSWVSLKIRRRIIFLPTTTRTKPFFFCVFSKKQSQAVKKASLLLVKAACLEPLFAQCELLVCYFVLCCTCSGVFQWLVSENRLCFQICETLFNFEFLKTEEFQIIRKNKIN